MRSGFDFADILDDILQRSLGENATAADVISARRSVHMVLESWHAQQFNTWRIVVQDFSFVPGVPRITLPLYVDDVLNISRVNRQTQGTPFESDVPMARISETEYAKLSVKNTPGQPTQFVLHRTEPPAVTFHPTGAPGANEIVRVTFIRRPDEFDRNSNDVGAPARWQNALILNAAYDMASKHSERLGEAAEGKIARLERQAIAALELAQQNDRQRVRFRLRIV